MELRDFAKAVVAAELEKDAAKIPLSAAKVYHKGKRFVNALLGRSLSKLNKKIGERAGDISEEAVKKLQRVRASHMRKLEAEQHKARVHAAIAGGGAAAGAVGGAGIAALAKRKKALGRKKD